MSTALLVSFVVGLVRVWRVPFVRDRVFGWVKDAPQWAQWAFPMVVAMLVALGEGLDAGVPPELLIAQVAERGGELGFIAIGVWHVLKRVLPLLKVRKVIKPLAAASILFLWSCVGTLEESRPKIALGAPPAVKRTTSKDELCRDISSAETWYGAGAVTSGVLSGASGLAAIPVKGDDAELALSVGVVTFAAAAVGFEQLAAGASREYTREGCGQ